LYTRTYFDKAEDVMGLESEPSSRTKYYYYYRLLRHTGST